MLDQGELGELKRWNTPSVYNGWERITRHDAVRDGFNLEPTHDYMPHLGPMVGHAVTLIIEPTNEAHKDTNPLAREQYMTYLASVTGPKIVVVQDLDKPRLVGAFWGEISATIHRVLGCTGTITDGAIRDLDEMTAAGFKAIARGLCVGHAHAYPVRWNCEVEVFGRRVQPGQFIHADKHGFLAVPPEDENRLLDATRIMDSAECKTVLAAARSATHKTFTQFTHELNEARKAFAEVKRTKFRNPR